MRTPTWRWVPVVQTGLDNINYLDPLQDEYGNFYVALAVTPGGKITAIEANQDGVEYREVGLIRNFDPLQLKVHVPVDEQALEGYRSLFSGREPKLGESHRTIIDGSDVAKCLPVSEVRLLRERPKRDIRNTFEWDLRRAPVEEPTEEPVKEPA